MPAVEYSLLGFCAALVVPSPKVQAWLSMVPVELLVKFTVSGAPPEVVPAVNCARGTLDGTVRTTSLEYPLSSSAAL